MKARHLSILLFTVGILSMVGALLTTIFANNYNAVVTLSVIAMIFIGCSMGIILSEEGRF